MTFYREDWKVGVPLSGADLTDKDERKDWAGPGGGKMELGTFSVLSLWSLLEKSSELYSGEARTFHGAAL